MATYYLELPVNAVANNQNVSIVSSSQIAGQFVGAQTNVTGVLDVLPVGQYNSSSLSVPDKNFVMLQVDNSGWLKVVEQRYAQFEDNASGVAATAHRYVASSSYAPSLTASMYGVGSGTIKTAQGNLVSARAEMGAGSVAQDLWWMFFNRTTLAADSTVPTLQFGVPRTTSSGPGVLVVRSEERRVGKECRS